MNQFSIILPVRNGGEYVKECVNSILAQTYPNFNLIVLDNCSDDGTKEWIENLNNDKIIIHLSQKSLGIEGNWGRIKDVKKNEFITLIGHDDVLLSNYLEVINELIIQYPNASLYQSHFNYIDSKNDFVRTCKPMAETQTAADFLECHIEQSLDSMGTGYMMRSKDFDALGGMPQNYPALLFADYELWIKLIAISFKATTKNILFNYRLHNSTSKTTDAIKYQKAFLEYTKFLSDYKNKNVDIKNISEKKGHIMFNFYCVTLSHRLLQTAKIDRNKSVNDFVKECVIMAQQFLGNNNNFKPYRSPQIIAAILIDSSSLGLHIFSKYRKWKYGSR